MSESQYDYRVRDIHDNGEFLTFATVDLLVDGKVEHTETFCVSGEDDPDDATRHAISYAQSWVESQLYTLEERLGPYGIEWEREQDERRETHA